MSTKPEQVSTCAQLPACRDISDSFRWHDLNCPLSDKQPPTEAQEREWPEKLTIIRYNDGGFSATQHTPPDKSNFTKVYVNAELAVSPEAIVRVINALLVRPDAGDDLEGDAFAQGVAHAAKFLRAQLASLPSVSKEK